MQILKMQLSHARNCPMCHVSVLRAQEAGKGEAHSLAMPAYAAIRVPKQLLVSSHLKPNSVHGSMFQGLGVLCWWQHPGTGCEQRKGRGKVQDQVREKVHRCPRA